MHERWFEHRLENTARPKVRYEYFVTGRGVFPFDMLRHDAAWPASGEDAARLEWEGIKPDRAPWENRSIKVRSYSKPTIERWASFGWSVGTEYLVK